MALATLSVYTGLVLVRPSRILSTIDSIPILIKLYTKILKMYIFLEIFIKENLKYDILIL